LLTSATAAQSSAPAASVAPAPGVQHSTKAINYRSAGSNLEIVFNGTPLWQAAWGEAEVKNQGNRVDSATSKTGQSSAANISPMCCKPFRFNQQLSERRSDSVPDFLAE